MEDLVAMLPASGAALAAAVAVTFVAATVQGTIGFGSAIVAVPILSLIDPALAPVPQLLLGIPLGVAMFLRERSQADFSGVGWILLGRFPGAALGILLLQLADARTLDAVLGAMVLIAVLVLASGWSVKRNAATKLLAGVASGTFGLVSAIGGPPLALLYRDAPGATTRATLAAIFATGIVINVSARVMASEIAWSDCVVAACLLPPLVAGLLLSRALTGTVEGRPLRIGILVVSSLAAIGLFVRAAL